MKRKAAAAGWFGPNRFGFGSGWATATPSRWQGRLVVLVGVGILAARGAMMRSAPAAAGAAALADLVALSLVVRATFARPGPPPGGRAPPGRRRAPTARP